MNEDGPYEFQNLGGLPSKPDYRARIVAMATAEAVTPVALPHALRTDFGKVGGPLNQRKTPACVSHAMAQLMTMWWYIKTGQIQHFSARFLHIMSGLPQYNGGVTLGPDDGRDPVTVAKIAQKYGCCRIETLPNDTTLGNSAYFDANQITAAVLSEAMAYRIPGYVVLKAEQQAIRQAIAQYGAVSILFKIGRQWWTDANGNVTWAQAAIDPVRAPHGMVDVVSGHEVVGDGWDSDIDHLLNSWSDAWAEHGGSEYIYAEQAPYMLEALAIAEVPSNALSIVQGLPPQGEFWHNFRNDLFFGNVGIEVRNLQIALSIDGEDVSPVGIYGPMTAKAVLAFQLKYNLDNPQALKNLAGRKVGPLTRAKLNTLFNHG